MRFPPVGETAVNPPFGGLRRAGLSHRHEETR